MAKLSMYTHYSCAGGAARDVPSSNACLFGEAQAQLWAKHDASVRRDRCSVYIKRKGDPVSYRLFLTVLSAAAAVALAIWPGCPAAAAPGPRGSRPLPYWRQAADPEPLRTAEYLEFLVAREKGALKVVAVERHAFSKPQVLLPRFRGRLEVRLLAPAGQLRDVVRFDFPLTGGAAPANSPDHDDVLGRQLAMGVSARVRVRAPFDAGVASAVLFDSLSKVEVHVDLSRFRGRGATPQWQAPVLRKHSPKPKP